MRKIIHIDMDCFYAAVEMREDPTLVGRPMAVGGGELGSVVTTCNYEARKYGVHSAMPGFMAKKRCPHIIFLPCRFDLYREASQQIRAIFQEYTSIVEPLSLDEAYLDVTDAEGFACAIAKEIRAKIFEETKLTASAGISVNKMLAKIASDWRKPNRQFAIRPDQVSDFMLHLPLEKIPGVGPTKFARLTSQGFQTCGDLQRLTLPELVMSEGKWGKEIYERCRGLDDRKVDPNWIPKSLSKEKTFVEKLNTLQECDTAISTIAEEMLAEIQLKAADRKIRRAFVIVKFSDSDQTTKRRACTQPTAQVFRELLADAYRRKTLPVRLLGAGVQFADVKAVAPQLKLFP